MIRIFGRLAIVLPLLGVGLVFPQGTARRVLVEVKDATHHPAENVRITIRSEEKSDLKKEFFTNKKGQTAFLLPQEIKNVEFLLEKEGYQTYQEMIELSRMRKSQEEMLYQVSFVLYQVHELTPAQLKQKKEIDQKALEFIDKGIDFFASGNFKDAIDQFETALKLNPDIPEAYQNLASAYFRAGFYQKAIEAAQKALDLNPNSVQMVKLLSVAYSSLGNEDKALEYHEKLKAFPDTEFSAEELYNMGVIEANRRNDGAAAEYFEKAARAKPDFALVHYQLGLCYFRLSNWEGAKKELGEYLALDPQGDNGETAKALLANIK